MQQQTVIVGIKTEVFPVYAVKACRGSRGIAPHILNLGAK